MGIREVKFNNKLNKKMNNKGSSLIMVLIIVSFIAILSAVCITSAMLNFKMKVVDKEAKKTFYTAEQAVDEIYNGLGKLSMEQLDVAYKNQMSTIIRQTQIPGTNLYMQSNIDNIQANADLRKSFTSNVVDKVISPGVFNSNMSFQTFNDDTSRNNFRNKLNSFLEETGKAEVISIADISISKQVSVKDARLATYTIKFSDCVVKYVKSGNDYYSEVEFDGVVGMPDVVVEFTKSVDEKLDTFKNYSLIGNSSVDISKTLNLHSGIYAGGSGLNLSAGAVLNADASTIVTSTDINLSGGTLNTSGGTNLWCTNIKAKQGSKSIISMDNTSSAYVKDDLQLDGDTSTASIAGDYYGYSYEGDTGHSNSSAMIVNGKGASLDLGNIKTLLLGGRAYIDFQSASSYDTYMTGESLSLKGDQEAYLIPSSFLFDSETNKNLANPMPVLSSMKATVNLTQDNFFGYKYLNPQKQYTPITVEGDVYYYLNFSSKEARTEYFQCILNDTIFNNLCSSLTSSNAIQAYKDTRNYMRSILQVNMGVSQLCQTSIVGNASSNIYTNGALVKADPGTQTVSDVTSKNYSLLGYNNVDAFLLNATDLNTRYKLISQFLFSPSMYETNIDGSAVLDASGNKKRKIYYSVDNNIIDNGSVIDITNLGADVFNNFINLSYLTANPGFNRKIGNYVMYASTGNVDLNNSGFFAGCEGGVIITSGSVSVSQDFRGLIIAGQKIFIADNANVYNINTSGSFSDVINFITQDAEFMKYFKIWNSSSEGAIDDTTSIAGVTYKDLISFDNWSKN